MKKTISRFFLIPLIVLSGIFFSRCAPDETQNPLEQRLDSLLFKMSMQEKIEQLYYKTDGNDRLGIPQFTGSDGPHGIGNNAKGFSSFPVTIAMAATWDPSLITRVGRAIALEQAARGRDRIAGPTLDLLIDPRIGNYYTMCDWGGFSSTEKALNSELDFCEGNDLYIKELPEGVKTGRYDSSLVERAARNVLRTKIISGMIDGVPEIPKSIIDSKEHRSLVYESGLKGLILLKNEGGILPLNIETVKSIAVIGPNAQVLPLDGNSSSKVIPSYQIPVENAIRTLLGDTRVNYTKGCNINDTDKKHFKEAISLAKKSEYVVFVAGLDNTVEGEGYFLFRDADEKGGGVVTRPDRVSQTVLLPGVQNELINEIAKVNPNIILVVISGGTCSVTPVIKSVKGLLYAFYPGQEGGRAIADVLFGNYNPSGKMPATMPKDDSQIIPISADFRNMIIKGPGYRWFDSQKLSPEFAFGYGLSYTTFEYSNIRLNKSVVPAGDLIEVTFDLKNTGKIPGEEVSQLYLSTDKIIPDLQMPVKQLRGFRKIQLNPDETKTISFTLTPEELYVYDVETKSYMVPEGKYIVKVGGSSDQLPLKTEFTLIKATGKADLTVKNIRTMPAFPKEGDEVIFMASLINNGTGPVKAGYNLKIRFYVDGKQVATYNSKMTSIPVGGMDFICGQGVKNKNWIASKGNFKVTAVIDVSESKELNMQNNKCEAELTIPGGKVIPAEIAAIIK